MNLGRRILSGFVWNVLELAIDRGFSLVVNLVLAKLLMPADFGLVGMASIFISVLQVFNDLGMGAALIQKKESEINDDYYNTAFFTGIGWSIFFYSLIAFGVGPLAAHFFNQPKLVSLVPVLCIGILISPINLSHRVKLTRALDFKRLVLINNVGNVGSGVLALLAAWAGLGVWALVINSVTASLFKMPLFMMFTKWKPSFTWSKKIFKEIFTFGMYTIGTGLIARVISQFDYLIIGKMAGSHMLGIYTFAFIITDVLRGQIMFLLNKVMYPVYGKLQDNYDKAKSYYYKVIRFNAMIVYPVTTLLILFSPDILGLLYGSKWIEAVPIVKVLSLSVFVSMTVNSYTAFLRGTGKANLEFRMSFLRLIVIAPAMYIGFMQGGVLGVAWGHFIATCFHTTVICIILVTQMDLRIEKILGAVLMPFVIAMVTFLVAKGLEYFRVPFLVNAILFMALSAALNYAAFREDLGKIITMIRPQKVSKI